MSTLNKSSFWFFLSVAFALLAGGVFFLFDLNNLMNTGNSHTTTHTREETTRHPDSKAEKIKKHELENNIPSATWITTKEGKPLTDVLSETDSLLIHSPNYNTAVYANEDIVVRKDKLLSTQETSLTVANEPRNTSPTDSMLEAISGIQPSKQNNASIRLEYWQSPVNFIGYKLSQTKLVLFGINPNVAIKLIRYENNLWMKHDGNMYQLSYSDELKLFEKIIDPSVIALLK
jgi:hypothetical protein